MVGKRGKMVNFSNGGVEVNWRIIGAVQVGEN